MTTPSRTYLAFQHDGDLTTLETTVQDIFPATQLDPANRTVFKGIEITDNDYIVITPSTIFHPQGGGQPSDTGTMTSISPSTNQSTFTVTAVRTATSQSTSPTLIPGQVLHLGTFTASTTHFEPSTGLTQTLNTTLRALYSKYHTAGHILGSATRHLLQTQIANFDELKASHFPSAASCEFQGLIPSSHKVAIQTKVDEFIAADMPVEIDWWDSEDFRREGLERLIPEMALGEGEKWRVVKIVGAEVYPCGGTHVSGTKMCVGTVVRKITRQKGNSRVSYVVE